MILYNSVAFLLIALSKTYSLPTEPNLDIKDEYIISFQNPDRSQLSSDQITSKYSNRLKSHGHNVVIKDAGRNTFEHHEDALLVKADRLDIDSLRQSGAKVYANKVVNIFGEQRPAPWNLARINTRMFNRSHDQYNFNDKGGHEIDVYIVDTGIDVNHPEFEGRAKFGASFVKKGKKTVDIDDNGHGTHVAGIVGSRSYGVAKKVTLIAVKCMNAEGSGTSFMIGQAIQFVVQEYKKTGRPSVINMSLGTESDEYIDIITEQAIKAGVYVIAAAGNSDESACLSSPARGEKVITVGATDPSDQKPKFSNYGRCVDVFAPGVSIKSTWMGGRYMTLDGTSMAAPHVAGVMAIILGENSRYRNVAKGTDYLKSILSVNRLSELNHSPNKLLFTSVKHLVEKGHPDVAPRICSVLECYMQRKECDDCAVLDAHVNALSQSNYIYGSSPEEQNVKMYSESHLKSDDAMDVSEY